MLPAVAAQHLAVAQGLQRVAQLGQEQHVQGCHAQAIIERDAQRVRIVQRAVADVPHICPRMDIERRAPASGQDIYMHKYIRYHKYHKYTCQAAATERRGEGDEEGAGQKRACAWLSSKVVQVAAETPSKTPGRCMQAAQLACTGSAGAWAPLPR